MFHAVDSNRVRVEEKAMKNVILAIFLVMICMNVYAIPGVTKDGYMACTTEEYLKDIFSFLAAKDTASVRAYISSYKCVYLKSGLKVTVLDTTWKGRLQFAFQGKKMWTVIEAVNMD